MRWFLVFLITAAVFGTCWFQKNVFKKNRERQKNKRNRSQLGPQSRRKMKDAEKKLAHLDEMLKGLKSKAKYLGRSQSDDVIRETKNDRGRKSMGRDQIEELEDTIEALKKRLGRR